MPRTPRQMASAVKCTTARPRRYARRMKGARGGSCVCVARPLTQPSYIRPRARLPAVPDFLREPGGDGTGGGGDRQPPCEAAQRRPLQHVKRRACDRRTDEDVGNLLGGGLCHVSWTPVLANAAAPMAEGGRCDASSTPHRLCPFGTTSGSWNIRRRRRR